MVRKRVVRKKEKRWRHEQALHPVAVPKQPQQQRLRLLVGLRNEPRSRRLPVARNLPLRLPVARRKASLPRWLPQKRLPRRLHRRP